MFVDVERARLPDLGASGGGEGRAGRLEAILAFLLSGRPADPIEERGGVDTCTEPLDGGGLGGGVRVLRSSISE